MAEAATSGDRRRRRRLGVAPARAGLHINDLRDDLLLHVLSHLSARRAVRTCVLSRRWRQLWRSIPRINASCQEFDRGDLTDEETEPLFKRFVNRFLMLRDPVGLHEFRLRYSLIGGETQADLDANSADANLWIGHALQCNAQAVEVAARSCGVQFKEPPQPAHFQYYFDPRPLREAPKGLPTIERSLLV